MIFNILKAQDTMLAKPMALDTETAGAVRFVELTDEELAKKRKTSRENLASIMTSKMIAADTPYKLKDIDEYGEYKPESENDQILIKGRWLERGGSAWIVSTAGTGKSIHSTQLAISMSAGLPFSGLTPNLVGDMKGLNFWVIQTEDSASRIAIDREDITAELAEQHPEIDWKEVRKRVKFLEISGKVGASFLDELTDVLTIAESQNCLPDIIIINPFMALIGGPITDGAYVTPFLRGGEINKKPTKGLQYILERFKIAALIYHHTPKPPTDKELDGWMKSQFPEYQGAGSADITNWGRSFFTMMRVKGDSRKVCITAGKNGGELGWDEIDGAYRLYMGWSKAQGITGKARHAWRELDEEELAIVTREARANESEYIRRIIDALKERPMYREVLMKKMESEGMPKRKFDAAWKKVSDTFGAFGLVRIPIKLKKSTPYLFGLESMVKQAAFGYQTGVYDD